MRAAVVTASELDEFQVQLDAGSARSFLGDRGKKSDLQAHVS
jgi:hypothetical protein